MEKYVLAGLFCLILFFQQMLFGVNDSLAVIFILIYVSFIYVSLMKLHAGNRKMLRVNSVQDSWLYRLLSQEHTVSMRIYVAISAFILSAIFVVMVKGMVLQKGFWVFFAIVIFSSIILYPFVNAKLNSGIIDRNLHEDITDHGAELVRILYASLVLNIVLSIVFSLYETIEFLNSTVDLSNFGQETLNESVEKTGGNEYSRIFINAYLLIDNLKVGLAKALVGSFDLQENFLGFYFAIFILNMLKLFAFSVSFVLLQKGLDGVSVLVAPLVSNFLSKVKNRIYSGA